MQRHEAEEVKEEYYEEVLENGLHVDIFHKPDYCTSSAVFMVGYGSLDHIQMEEDGTIDSFPTGTAHFLEHKLFESDHGDVMNDFSHMGANVNAYTSYEQTAYFFDLPGEIEEPLNLLLDFTQDLHLSEESVEKEKGIILEEHRMYEQDADSAIMLETMRSLYGFYPLREDITGSEADIQRMSRSDLERAYALNYHPSRCVLVCVSPQDPNAIMETIRANQRSKHFGPAHKLHRYYYHENAEVIRPFYQFSMDAQMPRSMIGIKLTLQKETPLARLKREWAVHMMLESWFSIVNPLYQKWLDEKKITPVFAYEEDFNLDGGILLFEDETDDPDGMTAFVQEQLSALRNNPISSELLEQLKKRTIGSLISIFNDPSSIADTWARARVSGVDVMQEMNVVKNLQAEECAEIFQELDLSHAACTYLSPLE